MLNFICDLSSDVNNTPKNKYLQVERPDQKLT